MVQFVNKALILAIGMLLMMAVGGAVEEISYSDMEEITESVLEEGSICIYNSNVDISSNKVAIEYFTDSSSAEEVIEDIGAVIGAYAFITQYYPEAGDLTAQIKDVTGDTIAIYSCKDEWVDDLDMDDEDALIDVLLKVMETFEAV